MYSNKKNFLIKFRFSKFLQNQEFHISEAEKYEHLITSMNLFSSESSDDLEVNKLKDSSPTDSSDNEETEFSSEEKDKNITKELIPQQNI